MNVVFFLLGNSRRLNFMCRRFGTLCSILICRVNKKTTYEDGAKCSETSAHKIQTPGNLSKERIQHSQHGESLKSGAYMKLFAIMKSKSELCRNWRATMAVRDQGGCRHVRRGRPDEAQL